MRHRFEVFVFATVGACAGQSPPDPAPQPALAPAAAAPEESASAAPSPVVEAPPPVVSAEPAAPPPEPETLESRLSRLSEEGLSVAADLIASRVAQSRQKMKLEPEQGFALAGAARELLPVLPVTQKLLAVMPKATVELVRSVARAEQSIYLPKGILDFKTEAHLRRFFQVESKAPYFVKLYKPRRTAP